MVPPFSFGVKRVVAPRKAVELYQSIGLYIGQKNTKKQSDSRLAVQFLLHHFFGMGTRQGLIVVEGVLQCCEHRWLMVLFGTIQTDACGDFGGAGLATHDARETSTAHVQVGHALLQTHHVPRLVALFGGQDVPESNIEKKR